MNNYISKKDLEEAYKKMEEEPLVLPPKAYKELQKIILENKQLKERLKNEEQVAQEYLKIEEKLDKVRNHIMKYYDGVNRNADELEEVGIIVDRKVPLYDELLEILGDKEND